MRHVEKCVPLHSRTRRDTLHVAFRSDKSPAVSKFVAAAYNSALVPIGRKTCLQALPHMEFLCSLEISVGPRLLAHGLEQTVIRENRDNPIYERETHLLCLYFNNVWFPRVFLSLSLSLFLFLYLPISLRMICGPSKSRRFPVTCSKDDF